MCRLYKSKKEIRMDIEPRPMTAEELERINSSLESWYKSVLVTEASEHEHQWVTRVETCLDGGIHSPSQHWHPSSISEAKVFEHETRDYASISHTDVFCAVPGCKVTPMTVLP